MNINTKALKGVIEEVEASKLRQKAEAEFQREAIKRAVKEHQLDGKAIRIVLQRRAMGDAKRDEQDYYVHAYEMALGGKKLAADALASGATIREAAAIGGISTGAAAALAKGVQKSEKIEHDAETGEIIETKPEDGDDGITESCGGVEGHAQSVGNVLSRDEPTPPSATGEPCRHVGAGVEPGPHDTPLANRLLGVFPKANEAPATPSVGAVGPEPRVAPNNPDDDDLTIPSFLDRRTPAQGRAG